MRYQSPLLKSAEQTNRKHRRNAGLFILSLVVNVSIIAYGVSVAKGMLAKFPIRIEAMERSSPTNLDKPRTGQIYTNYLSDVYVSQIVATNFIDSAKRRIEKGITNGFFNPYPTSFRWGGWLTIDRHSISNTDPTNMFLVVTAKPHVTRDGDKWVITFPKGVQTTKNIGQITITNKTVLGEEHYFVSKWDGICPMCRGGNKSTICLSNAWYECGVSGSGGKCSNGHKLKIMNKIGEEVVEATP